MAEKVTKLFTMAGFAFLGIGTLFKTCTYTVDAGQRAIIFDVLFGGLKEKIIGEGMHLYIPII